MVDLRLLRVVRPHIVAGGFLGYLVGVLYALNMGGTVSWTGFIIGYFIVLFMDLSTHFNNDYYDMEIDKQANFKPFGNVNQLIENPELKRPALSASISSTIISLVLAFFLFSNDTSWHLILVTMLFNTLGWLYSAPPIRLHSRRLGEATIALGTGLCIPAVGYIVAHGGISTDFLLFSVPLILYGFMLSLCLQVPDYEVDQSMGKKTITGLIGIKRTYFLAMLTAFTATATYTLFFPATISHIKTTPWLSMIPLTVSLLSSMFLTETPEHARLFTKLIVSALFMFLLTLNLQLYMGLN